jgi:hypothetical protein
MAQTIPIRIEIGIRDDLAILRRELSVKYNRDYSMSQVIRSLIQACGGNNPTLANNLREIIARIPETPLLPDDRSNQ